jgi:hypothetical protein
MWFHLLPISWLDLKKESFGNTVCNCDGHSCQLDKFYFFKFYIALWHTKVWGSHGGEDASCDFQDCVAMWSCSFYWFLHFTLKLETICSSETLVITYKTTWHHNPEDYYDILFCHTSVYFRSSSSVPCINFMLSGLSPISQCSATWSLHLACYGWLMCHILKRIIGLYLGLISSLLFLKYLLIILEIYEVSVFLVSPLQYLNMFNVKVLLPVHKNPHNFSCYAAYFAYF